MFTDFFNVFIRLQKVTFLFFLSVIYLIGIGPVLHISVRRTLFPEMYNKCLAVSISLSSFISRTCFFYLIAIFKCSLERRET